jgi:hypothetical protein
LDASAQFAATGLPRNHAARSAEELTWNAAFELAERLTGKGRHSGTVSFRDGLIDVTTSSESGQMNVRRARLHVQRAAQKAGILGRMLCFGVQARFTAATFVPAFLTFLDQGCSIGLAGEDPARLDRLRRDLSLHAPWHRFVVIDPSVPQGEQFDLVIVNGRQSHSDAIRQELSAISRTRLTILAGTELTGLGAGH